MNLPNTAAPRIVIVGGGFAGIELAKALRRKPYDVLLLDRNNHFTFQPLLYQVATGGLEPNSIAYPFRRLFRNAHNVRFRMAEVQSMDAHRKVLDTEIGEVPYDYLVLATGSKPRFFGLDQTQLLPLKSVPQALQMRNHILQQFERAVVSDSRKEKDAFTNFVVVGGGPTGVELAGALGEMKRFVLPKDYPELDFSIMHIHLIEGMDQLLDGMSDKSSEGALQSLQELGVEVHFGTLVDEYDGEKIELDGLTIPTKNLIWTAGVQADTVQGLSDTAIAENGRILVDEYNRVKGSDSIFAIGDVAQMELEDHPNGFPMLAPVAVQQGQHLAKNLKRLASGKEMEAFSYFDKGTMATIGRNRAVADVRKLHLRGFVAWLAWMFVHLITLVGFRNKLVVFINWVYNYFTYDKALRLIIRRGKNRDEYFEDHATPETANA